VPTVTLKTDDKLYGQIKLMADELHLSKSELIRRALIAYTERLHKKKVQQQLQKASLNVRNANKLVIEELDSLVADGLTDD
jgi:predicted transcriptional regulator